MRSSSLCLTTSLVSHSPSSSPLQTKNSLNKSSNNNNNNSANEVSWYELEQELSSLFDAVNTDRSHPSLLPDLRALVLSYLFVRRNVGESVLAYLPFPFRSGFRPKESPRLFGWQLAKVTQLVGPNGRNNADTPTPISPPSASPSASSSVPSRSRRLLGARFGPLVAAMVNYTKNADDSPERKESATTLGRSNSSGGSSNSSSNNRRLGGSASVMTVQSVESHKHFEKSCVDVNETMVDRIAPVDAVDLLPEATQNLAVGDALFVQDTSGEFLLATVLEIYRPAKDAADGSYINKDNTNATNYNDFSSIIKSESNNNDSNINGPTNVGGPGKEPSANINNFSCHGSNSGNIDGMNDEPCVHVRYVQWEAKWREWVPLRSPRLLPFASRTVSANTATIENLQPSDLVDVVYRGVPLTLPIAAFRVAVFTDPRIFLGLRVPDEFLSHPRPQLLPPLPRPSPPNSNSTSASTSSSNSDSNSNSTTTLTANNSTAPSDSLSLPSNSVAPVINELPRAPCAPKN